MSKELEVTDNNKNVRLGFNSWHRRDKGKVPTLIAFMAVVRRTKSKTFPTRLQTLGIYPKLTVRKTIRQQGAYERTLNGLAKQHGLTSRHVHKIQVNRLLKQSGALDASKF